MEGYCLLALVWEGQGGEGGGREGEGGRKGGGRR